MPEQRAATRFLMGEGVFRRSSAARDRMLGCLTCQSTLCVEQLTVCNGVPPDAVQRFFRELVAGGVLRPAGTLSASGKPGHPPNKYAIADTPRASRLRGLLESKACRWNSADEPPASGEPLPVPMSAGDLISVLAYARRETGTSQSAIGDAIGLSVWQVSRIERGDIPATLDQAVQYAAALGLQLAVGPIAETPELPQS